MIMRLKDFFLLLWQLKNFLLSKIKTSILHAFYLHTDFTLCDSIQNIERGGVKILRSWVHKNLNSTHSEIYKAK